jgi:hypothetical protein
LEPQFEPAPVRVFLVWHPKYSEGEAVLQALYEWLGGTGRDLYRRGLGVPVHGWTSDADESPPEKLPLDNDTLTIVVPILDGEFLGRQSWRRWLSELRGGVEQTERSVAILPWAVHQASAQVPGIGLLHVLGSGLCDTKQLCRRVTEACVVRVRDPANPRPLRIFVSYARKDGSAIAREVRTALQNYGHLSVFLDEHDLQPGEHWRDGLAAELKHGAAMFAIVTDAYASRAWCREELRQFREPQREKSSSLWSLRPVFILDNLSGSSTRSMFEVGSAPAARWNPDRATEVVDELLREILFSEVNRIRASRVEGGVGVRVINWVPDTWTLLQVLRTPHETGPQRIAYPGDGLPTIELERLTRVLPQLSLCSFEQLGRENDPRGTDRSSRRRDSNVPRTPVLLSISDPPRQDLTRNGLSPLHLDDAAVRIARCLLSDDFDVMYGGRPRSGFTEGFQDDSGTVVVEARLINYVGWPYSDKLSANQVADQFGVTRYVKVARSGSIPPSEGEVFMTAEAATHSRQAVVRPGLRDLDEKEIPQPIGLIALGGQLSGFAGFLPGVAEEIAIALEAGLAVYVLGGFGGAAQQVAAVLAGNGSEALTVGGFMANEKYRALRELARAQGRETELDRRAEWLGTVLRRNDFSNGLTDVENTFLWNTLNLAEAIALISKGLRRRRQLKSSA